MDGGFRIGGARGSWGQNPAWPVNASRPVPSRLLTIGEFRLVGTLLSLSLLARTSCGLGFSSDSQHLQVHSWASDLHVRAALATAARPPSSLFPVPSDPRS